MPFVRPMLATKGDRVPAGADWVHEVKWDGIRAIVTVTPGEVRAFTRNANEVPVPHLADLGALGHAMTLDAELVNLGERGPGAARQGRLFVFDLLTLDGEDLMPLPWSERRARLDALHLGDEEWVVPPTYDDGEMLLAATRDQGLEGIVSKLRSAPYRPGVRSRDWLKFPHRPRESYVVGGWRPEKDTTGNRLGAILVGRPTEGGLAFLGRVGSGLAGKAGARLAEQLAGLARPTSPFVEALPRADTLGTTWVEPRIVVDIESLGIGSQGRLRQPSYQGVRIDLTPEDLR
ncbi:ATP-dependent DNA ligase [Nocardioides ultimimeridianus]